MKPSDTFNIIKTFILVNSKGFPLVSMAYHHFTLNFIITGLDISVNSSPACWERKFSDSFESSYESLLVKNHSFDAALGVYEICSAPPIALKSYNLLFSRS